MAVGTNSLETWHFGQITLQTFSVIKVSSANNAVRMKMHSWNEGSNAVSYSVRIKQELVSYKEVWP
jgi:hypothetical protein